jgi:hypothetical protein
LPVDGTLNQTLDLVIDESKSVYYPLLLQIPKNREYQYSSQALTDSALERFLFDDWSRFGSEEDKESISLKRYVRVKEDIVPLLTHLQRQQLALHPTTEATSLCVCPLFLNLVANVSFLFDTSEQRWLVMAQPTIHRNNSFAELVASSVSYNEKSLFYKRHLQWQKYVGKADLIHYDSFVIEYIEPVDELLDTMTNMPTEVFSTLSSLNQKLEETHLTTARLFYRLKESEVQAQRKKVHVSGSDAICFIYCDTMQQRFLR